MSFSKAVKKTFQSQQQTFEKPQFKFEGYIESSDESDAIIAAGNLAADIITSLCDNIFYRLIDNNEISVQIGLPINGNKDKQSPKPFKIKLTNDKIIEFSWKDIFEYTYWDKKHMYNRSALIHELRGEIATYTHEKFGKTLFLIDHTLKDFGLNFVPTEETAKKFKQPFYIYIYLMSYDGVNKYNNMFNDAGKRIGFKDLIETKYIEFSRSECGLPITTKKTHTHDGAGEAIYDEDEDLTEVAIKDTIDDDDDEEEEEVVTDVVTSRVDASVPPPITVDAPALPCDVSQMTYALKTALNIVTISEVINAE